MNKVLFHEQLHKGLWENVIEYSRASYRLKMASRVDKNYPFDSVFTLLDALVKAPEDHLDMSESCWATLLSDGDTERALANPCKGLGWRVKRIYDELRRLSSSLKTIEGARTYRSHNIQKPLTFKELQDIIKFYRDDAKVFFVNLQLYMNRMKIQSNAWRRNWSVQLGLMFEIPEFQYIMRPSTFLIEIEVLKKRYLIGRKIIDFDNPIRTDVPLDVLTNYVPEDNRDRMGLSLRNYWTEKVSESLQEDENMITCERCGRYWDGMAQCPCGIWLSDEETESDSADTDDDEVNDDDDDDEVNDDDEVDDDDDDDDDDDYEEVQDTKKSIKKIQTIIDGEINGKIPDGIYLELMNQLKLAFNSC